MIDPFQDDDDDDDDKDASPDRQQRMCCLHKRVNQTLITVTGSCLYFQGFAHVSNTDAESKPTYPTQAEIRGTRSRVSDGVLRY